MIFWKQFSSESEHWKMYLWQKCLKWRTSNEMIKTQRLCLECEKWFLSRHTHDLSYWISIWTFNDEQAMFCFYVIMYWLNWTRYCVWLEILTFSTVCQCFSTLVIMLLTPWCKSINWWCFLLTSLRPSCMCTGASSTQSSTFLLHFSSRLPELANCGRAFYCNIIKAPYLISSAIGLCDNPKL